MGAAIPEEPTQEPTFEDLEPAPDDLPPLDSPSAWTQPAPEQRPTEKRLDVDQALREFRRDVVRQPVPMTPQAAESAPNIVMPRLSEIPTSGYGMGPLHFESIDYDWNDYGRQIYWAIWRAWHNRLYVTADDFEKWAHGADEWYLRHQAQVRFVIQGNGQVEQVVLESGSGCGPLDDSATDALREVILPPLPRDFPRDSEVVHATFFAKGWIRHMRPALRRMKSEGLF